MSKPRLYKKRGVLIWSAPRKAYPDPLVGSVRSAWFYENPGSIDLVVHMKDGASGMVNIRRTDLADWMKRTRKKAGKP